MYDDDRYDADFLEHASLASSQGGSLRWSAVRAEVAERARSRVRCQVCTSTRIVADKQGRFSLVII